MSSKWKRYCLVTLLQNKTKHVFYAFSIRVSSTNAKFSNSRFMHLTAICYCLTNRLVDKFEPNLTNLAKKSAFCMVFHTVLQGLVISTQSISKIKFAFGKLEKWFYHFYLEKRNSPCEIHNIKYICKCNIDSTE